MIKSRPKDAFAIANRSFIKYIWQDVYILRVLQLSRIDCSWKLRLNCFRQMLKVRRKEMR
jgi:hypothetical protein